MTDTEEYIHIIATGGTIDGVYNPSTERKVTRSKSVISQYLSESIRPHFSIKFKELMMIDSLDMTNKDRENIVDVINASPANKIVITHGTGTMVETAQFLENRLGENNKTIVFVGAMVPLEGFHPTDAPFNLGFALAQVQLREAGIYLCMNAQCFTAHETVKNVEDARFEFKDAP